MPFENKNLLIHVFEEDRKAIVLLKKEQFLSDILEQISGELAKIEFSGDVVFDEMLLKGIDERYYCMSFHNKQFDISHFFSLKDPGIQIISFSKQYYRLHTDLLNNSNMAKSQKELVIKWIND